MAHGPFSTAYCAVGGGRGARCVPQWFGALPELGVEHVRLFWSVPDMPGADAALSRLPELSNGWLRELRALGLRGDLAIKRGAPGPWLAELAELTDDALIVVGPPSAPERSSATLTYLLESAVSPLLILPDLATRPVGALLARVVIDTGPDLVAPPPVAHLSAHALDTHFLDLDALPPLDAVRTALRMAEDLDATLLVFPRRAQELALYAARVGTFPLLIVPEPPAAEG